MGIFSRKSREKSNLEVIKELEETLMLKRERIKSSEEEAVAADKKRKELDDRGQLAYQMGESKIKQRAILAESKAAEATSRRLSALFNIMTKELQEAEKDYSRAKEAIDLGLNANATEVEIYARKEELKQKHDESEFEEFVRGDTDRELDSELDDELEARYGSGKHFPNTDEVEHNKLEVE